MMSILNRDEALLLSASFRFPPPILSHAPIHSPPPSSPILPHHPRRLNMADPMIHRPESAKRGAAVAWMGLRHDVRKRRCRRVKQHQFPPPKVGTNLVLRDAFRRITAAATTTTGVQPSIHDVRTAFVFPGFAA